MSKTDTKLGEQINLAVKCSNHLYPHGLKNLSCSLCCLNKNILQLDKRKGTNFLKARRRRHCPQVQGEMKLKITQANFHCANKANGQKDNLRMDSFSRWKVLRRRKLSFIIQPSTLPAQDFLLHVSRVILCTSAGFDDPHDSLDTGSTDQL